MKTLEEKRQAIQKVRNRLISGHEEFDRGNMREVSNVGYLFFISYSPCVLRDLVKDCRDRFGIPVEILDYEVGYFAGSQEKAQALKEAFGGCSERSEWLGIYIWESPNRKWIEFTAPRKCLVDLEQAREVLLLA